MLTTVLTLALTLASTTAPEAGTAQLTFGGETTVHPIADCAMTPTDGVPARLLIEEVGLTLVLARADHVQTISVIRDNTNWSATRMNIGGQWTDRGRPAGPIVQEWGPLIRAEAVLAGSGKGAERQVSLVARC